MSKTLEATLRKPVLKEDVLNTHIANTYFYQKARPKSRRKKTVLSLKKLSFICGALASLIAVMVFLSAAASFVYVKYIDLLKEKFAKTKVVKVVDGGNINREFVKKFEFRGNAKNRSSRIQKEFVVVNNTKKYGWAGVAINFRFPLDLSGRNLSLVLRGRMGGEKINVVLRDANHKSVRLGDTYLSSRWHEDALSLTDTKKYIDLTRIDQLRIESGYVGESNKLDSPVDLKIYVKDLAITKGDVI